MENVILADVPMVCSGSAVLLCSVFFNECYFMSEWYAKT